jgi:hypothetical protein
MHYINTKNAFRLPQEFDSRCEDANMQAHKKKIEVLNPKG